MTDRYRRYRDRLRGGPARVPKPCGTVAAARRHQRAGEPLCDACRQAWREHQHAMYLRRKGRQALDAGDEERKMTP